MATAKLKRKPRLSKIESHKAAKFRRAAAAGYVPMSNDTKLEAKLHFFNISSFIRLDF